MLLRNGNRWFYDKNAEQTWVLPEEKGVNLRKISEVVSETWYNSNNIISYSEENKFLFSELEKKWFSFDQITAIELKNWTECLKEINTNLDIYLSIFWDIITICMIWEIDNWFEKLIYISNNIHKIKLIKFSGRNLYDILRSLSWENKLKYFENENKSDILQELWFKAIDISKIIFGKWWEEKLEYIGDIEEMKRFKELWFNSNHMSDIMIGKWWKEKLKYIESSKYNQVLKLWFNNSHISKIMLGKWWKEKLEYIENKKNIRNLLLKYTHYEIGQIFLKKNWKELLSK